MKRSEFLSRINELAKQVMTETDPDKLLQLMQELNGLFSSFVSNPPPEESKFVYDAMRLYEPRTKDIEWAAMMMDLIKDGGTLGMPTAQLEYKVDHQNHSMTLQNPDQLFWFDSFTVHLQTIATFARIGYTVNERKAS